MGTDINENTAKIHRESVSKAFDAKPAPTPEPAKKPPSSEAEAKDLQAILGKDVVVKPKAMKKGGKVKSASARADGCAIRGKTRA
jgi:hypothetical protein